MEWKSFERKFHKSWHDEIKPFIESEECNKIFSFLKNNKGKGTIWPASINTFRNFKHININNIKCALIFREPFSDTEPDGIPLSDEINNLLHPWTDKFYNAMEKEFYDLNLHILKKTNMKYLFMNGVFMHNADVTVFKDSPGSHRDVWVDFTTHIINILVKRNIPIVFIGKDLEERFGYLIPTGHPIYTVEQSIHDKSPIWKTNGEFLDINDYLWNETKLEDIMWVESDLPF